MTQEQFTKVEKLLKKIAKRLKDKELEWIIQASKSSLDGGEKIYYSAQINVPHQSLKPLMWTKDNAEDRLFALEASAKHLDRDAVTKAYYELELSRAENAVEEFKKAIADLENTGKKSEKEVK